jgi:hypothetical protein
MNHYRKLPDHSKEKQTSHDGIVDIRLGPKVVNMDGPPLPNLSPSIRNERMTCEDKVKSSKYGT